MDYQEVWAYRELLGLQVQLDKEETRGNLENQDNKVSQDHMESLV